MIDDIINHFESIPDDQWCIGAFLNNSGQRCAAGHLMCCGMSFHEIRKSLSSRLCLKSLTGVNDAMDADYQQPTPKARVLAFLNDIKKELNVAQ